MNRFNDAKREAIQQRLKTKAATLDDLVALTGLAKPTVRLHINALREAKEVYVHSYVVVEGKSGNRTMKFAWGNRADAVQPAGMTALERMRLSRARRRAV